MALLAIKKNTRNSVCAELAWHMKNRRRGPGNEIAALIVGFFFILVLYSYLPVFSAPNTPLLFPLL